MTVARPAKILPQLDQSTFDLNASNPRIIRLAQRNPVHRGREIACLEATLPPGGARLVTFHCQRYGGLFQSNLLRRHCFRDQREYCVDRSVHGTAKNP